MARKPSKRTRTVTQFPAKGYDAILADVVGLLEAARRASARSANAVMTATYWLIGRRIVEHEQQGRERAEYGQALLKRLSADLARRFGRGFSVDNLERMRLFYDAFKPSMISATAPRRCASRKSATPSRISEAECAIEPAAPLAKSAADTIAQTMFAQLAVPAYKVEAAPGRSRWPREHHFLAPVAARFPLPWSHYVRLLAVKNPHGRAFYEAEALRGGWSIRQLDRQIGSMFYERAALSRNKAAMLRKGEKAWPQDGVTPEEELKDPFVLEFLGLKDEYSESELEDALIRHLETFLLELGGEFTFVARQRRLRIGGQWYRVDLIFYHRRLRCLVIIDLKLDRFTHADAGQMHLYLNYARKHWTMPGENPPVGVILCAEKDNAMAQYALEGLPNKVLAAEYRMTLPDEETLVAELKNTRRLLEARRANPIVTRRRRPKHRGR